MIVRDIKQFLAKHNFEAMDLKAVLFDMDGVLFDSMPSHSVSWARVAQRFGLDLTPEEAYLHEGRTGAGTIDILARRSWGREATAEEHTAIYKAKCEEFNRMPPAGRMPGACELLNKVKESGLLIVLVTGSGQLSLLDRLEQNFPGIFCKELMVTSFDVKHGKPDPEPYLLALSKAGVEPWQAVVIENAPLGVQASAAANIFTIAVNTGPIAPELLTAAGADVVLPDIMSLSDGWEEVYSDLTNSDSLNLKHESDDSCERKHRE